MKLPTPEELARRNVPTIEFDARGHAIAVGHRLTAIRERDRLIVEWIDREDKRVAEFRTHALFAQFGDVNGQVQYERALAAVRAAITGEPRVS